MAGMLVGSLGGGGVGAPVVHISPMGNLGNQMIQYMAARAVAEFAGPARLSCVNLPLFGVLHPVIEGDFPVTKIVTRPLLEVDRLAHALATGQLQRVDIRTYAQRIDNFLPAQAYRPTFVARGEPDAEGAADDELLCNIRQGDILDGHHPDYVLIPLAFYAELAARTGLRLVFMGQLEASPYVAALRARFADARFVPSGGAAVDFERVRRSRFIVPCISTFSWLAAWLSDAERIYFPLLGLFNPVQNRDVDLVPLRDPRYLFYQFPVHYGAPVAEFAAAGAAVAGMSRQIDADQLACLMHRIPAGRQKQHYVAAFDEAYYRGAYPDIDQAVVDGHMPSGRHHYEICGFDEGRTAFALDRAWYCRTYPIAAVEIAAGGWQDPEQHWLEVGRARGYHATPRAVSPWEAARERETVAV
jgi:hypothetical protein